MSGAKHTPARKGEMKLTIEISGNDWADLELALAKVQRAVSEEYLSGFDSNDTGSYRFNIEGEPAEGVS